MEQTTAAADVPDVRGLIRQEAESDREVRWEEGDGLFWIGVVS
jgi:hypothetical protein